MLRIFLASFLVFCSLIEFSYAASKVMCPEKVLDTLTIEGTYLGFFEGEEINSVGIRIGKDDVHIMCSEDEANSFFGSNKGKKVSLTYDLEQFFLEYGKSGECMRMEICKKGSPIESVKESTQNSLHSLFTLAKSNELKFYFCTGDGNTVEKRCWIDGKEGGETNATAVNFITLRKVGTGVMAGYKDSPSDIKWFEKNGKVTLEIGGLSDTYLLKNMMYLDRDDEKDTLIYLSDDK